MNGAGGDPRARQRGWLKDRYDLSWQIMPRVFLALPKDHRSRECERAMAAMSGWRSSLSPRSSALTPGSDAR